MKLGNVFTACAAICILAANAGFAQTNPAWDWTTASPESQGMSGRRLKEMTDALATRNTTGLLVIRNDKIVCEWYAPGFNAKTPQGTASMAKAVVGGVSLAVAITDGRIALDDKAAKFIPQWRDDPRKNRITIRQLGSHTSGLADAEIWDAHTNSIPHEKLPGWEGEFWKRLNPPRDPFTISRDHIPVLNGPGEKFEYSNPGLAMMVYAMTAALKEDPDKDIRALLRDRVMQPIGVPDAEWSIGYHQTSVVDGLPLIAAWGGASYTARALGRVGRLLLREGNWEGRQLLSPESVRLTTSDAGTPGVCGIGWLSNNEGRWASMPKDAYFGAGAGHRTMVIVPSLKLIAVRFGNELAPVSPLLVHSDLMNYVQPTDQWFFEPLMEAVTDKKTPAITGAP